ncbi:zinc ribbon domain-containing protein [Anaerocolumna jejuensis]|uniref:zinc ribbon domain-containing protein n=1 Tax=Anaerocolumna jejuensis TaxID=259063 RepID=UPI003F7B8489
MKVCISCGMPMTKKSDYPLEDESKDYCIYCARQDGTLQSYEERLKGTTKFLIRTQGMDENAAHELAIRTMKKMPAWENAASL